MYYVYALYNRSADKTYIGQTHDLTARLSAHNQKHKTKSYTAHFEGEWKLVYKETFSTRSEALRREKQLKSHQGRGYIRTLIKFKH